jgi:dTDP-N-acetylfucosamine:lipid II N-acetylfucosaminyltransferase
MILHFIRDEKITDQIIENFGAAENSVFLVFLDSNHDSYKYLTKINSKVVDYKGDFEFIDSLITTTNINAILVHGLHPVFFDVILRIPRRIKIAWYVWGFDVYGLPKIKPHIYAPQTNKFLAKQNRFISVERFIKRSPILRKIFYEKIKGSIDYFGKLDKVISRIDYFVSYIKEDYLEFSKFYSHGLSFQHCSLCTIDQYLAGTDFIIDKNASNILIGNSNSPECNHLDVFSILNTQQRDSKSLVYVPLSYGNNDSYKKNVIESGYKLLSSGFTPLLDFMSRPEYVTLLKSCSVGIFYHFRQQAMGNIIAMLYLGCRIYLAESNPLYKYFVRNKITVFELKQDFPLYGNSTLEDQIVFQNRGRLSKLFGKREVATEIEQLYQLLDQS